MVFNTFELQASRSDTTEVLYVLRVRALRIDSREKFHGFKHAYVKQNSFNKLNSKSGENCIRMAFSPPQDSPGAKPWGFPSALNLNPGVYRPSPKSAHAPKVPPRPSKTPPQGAHKLMLTFVLYWFLRIKMALGQTKKIA